jgi:protein ImuB
MARCLCVWLPNWAIDNWRRRSAGSGEVLALATIEAGVRRLTAVDEGAARLGLYVGQKAADASALVPTLQLADSEPEADRCALTVLADWCVRFSPAVAMDPPDGLFLDITGVAHLWGGEAAMRADLLNRLIAQGFAAQAAVAGSAAAAWALARFAPAVVASGAEAEHLAPLPVAALNLEPETTVQLARLGLKRIDQLAALPRRQVAQRFGEAVWRRLDQALGAAGEALIYRRPPTPWLVRVAFAEPISAPDDLARVCNDLSEQLCARLEAAGQGGRAFELTFHRLDGRFEATSISLALAGRDWRAVARLLRPRLETIDPGFGIEAASLTAAGVETVSAEQCDLERVRGRQPEALAPFIDRLVNRLGATAVWRNEAFPSHAPERAARRRPPLAALVKTEGWGCDRPRPLRLFRRPEPIEAVAPVPDDPPLMFRWRGRVHRVWRAEGPERLAEEWWRRPFDDADRLKTRDYYQVEDEAGARFWLFRAGLYDGVDRPKWWLHGLFG